MNIQTNTGLAQARELLKQGTPETARKLLEDTLSRDLQNPEIIFTLKCATYWGQRLPRILELPTAFERAESLVSQWKQFTNFIANSPCYEQSVYAVKFGIFNLALENYQQLFNENNKAQKAEVFRKTGLCYKKLGDFETALRFLKDAYSFLPEYAPILAEMADCYALCGEEKTAKLLFREAFYIDAQKIDIDFLESELIIRLISRVEENNYPEEVLKEWIPVYGVLYGVLNIKRELRAIEVGKLKQAVFSLENELKESGSNPAILIPRLINHYFWLVDYYVNSNDDDRTRTSINEILLKIKYLDPKIHELYII